jgi:hypothetical protein
MPNDRQQTLMLLDTASLYFRAFFGVPDSFKAPDGTSVNAVRGLLDFISRLVGEYQPSHLVCCWDNDWRPQWRVDLVPSYKAHRVEYVVQNGPDVEVVPDPLEIQVPIIREVLDAFGITVIGADGYEADDVIGTLATDAGMPVDVVTGDRDLFQLVDDDERVRVLYIARGVGRHERVTNEVVRSKYGIDGRQYADFAALPACPGSVRRPRRRCSTGSATSTGSWRRPMTRTRTSRPVRAARSRRRSRTSPSPRRSWRSHATSTSGSPTSPCRARRPTRTCSSRSRTSGAWTARSPGWLTR